jgi:hypothetical protein
MSIRPIVQKGFGEREVLDLGRCIDALVGRVDQALWLSDARRKISAPG